jgi:hypothetical protein
MNELTLSYPTAIDVSVTDQPSAIFSSTEKEDAATVAAKLALSQKHQLSRFMSSAQSPQQGCPFIEFSASLKTNGRSPIAATGSAQEM